MEKMGNVRIYDKEKRTVSGIKFLNGEVNMFNKEYLLTIFLNKNSIDVKLFIKGFMPNSIYFKVKFNDDKGKYIGEYVENGMVLQLSFSQNKFRVTENLPVFIGEINFIRKVTNVIEELEKRLSYCKSLKELKRGFYMIDNKYKIYSEGTRAGKLTKVYMNNLKLEIASRIKNKKVIESKVEDLIQYDESKTLDTLNIELKELFKLQKEINDSIENKVKEITNFKEV